MKILIIRTDRIGDLILSIPVIKAIKHVYRKAQIDFIASIDTGQFLSDVNEISNLYLLKRDQSNFNEILKIVKKEKYTHSITLMVDKYASWIPLKAKIPIRIGPFSKFSSFIKFNSGIFQHRSKSVKNEAQYNLDLLKKIGINYKDISVDILKPTLKVNSISLDFELPNNFGIIHPGMRGSALNLKMESYLNIYKILSNHIPIFLTFGPSDSEYFDFFSQHIAYSNLIRNLNLVELTKLYSDAKFFIGPSTGPMHIAAACGTKVFAIFSPIKVQSATRWSPWGNNATIIEPQITCKEKYNCNSNCTFWGCTQNLTPDRITSKVISFLGEI